MRDRWWRRSSWTRFVPGLVVPAFIAGLAVPTEAIVGAEFVATAEASGGYVQYGIPGFLIVDNYIDGGGPVAQSVVDSSGTAQSFASLPYPGATGVTLPGLANALFGLPVPPYAFYASASHPTQPEERVADPLGVYVLAASTREGQANGEGRLAAPGEGDPKSGSRARSEVISTADSVSASATSVADAFSVGPLSVASVRSTSVTKYEAGGEPVTQTELIVEGGRVGDVTFSFGPDGLQVADKAIPVPAGQGLSGINQALAPAGLSIGFQQPTHIAGGAVAAIFEVVSVADVPGAGKGTLRIRLGGAISAVSLAEGSLPRLPADLPPDTGTEPLPEIGPDSSFSSPPPARELSFADSDPAPAPSIRATSPSRAPNVRSGLLDDGSGVSPSPEIATATAPATLAAPPGPPDAVLASAGPPRSLRAFDSLSVFSALLVATGALALGLLVVWSRARRLAQWTS
jgi:hypothetical protein